MRAFKKAVIIPLIPAPFNGINYNVQLWHETEAGLVYSGNGKYFETHKEAEQFAAENAEAWEDIRK